MQASTPINCVLAQLPAYLLLHPAKGPHVEGRVLASPAFLLAPEEWIKIRQFSKKQDGRGLYHHRAGGNAIGIAWGQRGRSESTQKRRDAQSRWGNRQESFQEGELSWLKPKGWKGASEGKESEREAKWHS